ncbi:hypothetical protein B0H67DRAFT_642504 [Lasiosphaeris hirsuta]|uniref:Uncharacterized protein n=1 Tax=Lasiosphaeris hirsuta TaxID=260670 RepID=A0AA40DZV1_9PEZI|nr:hypothetical protein B0H67DRAFT_642504 [Lasiosphaeris hirsuta]
MVLAEATELANFAPQPLNVVYAVPDATSARIAEQYFQSEATKTDGYPGVPNTVKTMSYIALIDNLKKANFASALLLIFDGDRGRMSHLCMFKDGKSQHSVTVVAPSPLEEPLWSRQQEFGDNVESTALLPGHRTGIFTTPPVPYKKPEY